jgi:hypothetical protein
VSQEGVVWKASLNNLIPVCGEVDMHDGMHGGSDFSSNGSGEGTEPKRFDSGFFLKKCIEEINKKWGFDMFFFVRLQNRQ